MRQRTERVAREEEEGLVVAELVAAKKCSVNALLNESREVKAGKDFRGVLATCSFETRWLRGG